MEYKDINFRTCSKCWDSDPIARIGCCVFPGQRVSKKNIKSKKVGEMDLLIEPLNLWFKGCPVLSDGCNYEVYGPYLYRKDKKPLFRTVGDCVGIWGHHMQNAGSAIYRMDASVNVPRYDGVVKPDKLEVEITHLTELTGKVKAIFSIKLPEYGLVIRDMRLFDNGDVDLPAWGFKDERQEPISWAKNTAGMDTLFTKSVARALGQ